MDELREDCYPCGVRGRRCVTNETWQPRSRGTQRQWCPVLPYVTEHGSCAWYDVALWLREGVNVFPTYISYVEAVCPFAAVEQLMRFHGLLRVAYASARSLDGSQVYRAHKVKLRDIGSAEEAHVSEE